ncbi:MAG: MFS transporter [Archangium sp.]|nr:MFS transporter [Archangium sp.]
MSNPHVPARSTMRLWLGALLVLGAMLPGTIVIPVVRSFVTASWPGAEWLMHAFIAVNLLGAVVGGPLLAVRAERMGRRRLVAGVSAALDGALLLLVTLSPPVWLLLGLRFLQGAVYIAAVSILMGTIRRQSKSPAAMGVVGCAVVLSILIGIPLGAILAKTNPTLPLLVGGVIGVLTGLIALVVLPKSTDAEQSRVTFKSLIFEAPLLRGPTIVVALERFAVGAFIVPLQLYGHHVLGVPDSTVNGWFSAFLMIFALGTWPMARLGDRVDRWKLIAFGALIYAGSYVALPFVPVQLIVVVLSIAGLASAAIYGPSLGLAAQAVPDTARASAMAVLNAAGTLGMFLGSTLAGGISSALLSAGVERGTAYTVVFVAAGVVQLASVGVALSAGRSAEGLAAAERR